MSSGRCAADVGRGATDADVQSTDADPRVVVAATDPTDADSRTVAADGAAAGAVHRWDTSNADRRTDNDADGLASVRPVMRRDDATILACSAESSAVLVTMAKIACACPHLCDNLKRVSASLDCAFAVAGSDCTKRISTVDVRSYHPAEIPRASHQRAWQPHHQQEQRLRWQTQHERATLLSLYACRNHRLCRSLGTRPPPNPTPSAG